MQYKKFTSRYHTLLFPLLFIGILVYTSSCTPEKRAQRHLRRAVAIYPPIIKKDTVFVDVPVIIPAVDIDTTLPVTKDTTALLKLIDHYASLLDSVAGTKLKTEIRYIIKTQRLFTDTAVAVVDGYTLKVWDNNGKLAFSIKKPEEVKNISVPAEVNTVEVRKKEKTIWEKIDDYLDWILICIVILLFFYILIKRV